MAAPPATRADDVGVLWTSFYVSRVPHFQQQGPGLVVTSVVDHRKLASDVLGPTAFGLVHHPAELRLDRPVTEFVEGAFARMLAPTPNAPRVEIAIEAFEVGWRGALLAHNRVFAAMRFAVTVVGPDGPTPAGRIEWYRAQEVGLLSVRGRQESMIYRGLAEVAQALDRGRLPITVAAPHAGVPPTVALGTVGRKLENSRNSFAGPTPAAERQLDFMGASEDWIGQQMKDTYVSAEGIGGVRVTQWRGANGVRVGVSSTSDQAHAPILDPSWSASTATLSIDLTYEELTWLRRIGRPDRERALRTYVGLGVTGVEGNQWVRLVARSAADSIDVKAGGLRASIGVHALVGGRVRVIGPLCLTAEASWIQGLAAPGAHPSVGARDRATWNTLTRLTRIPAFDPTGFGVTVAVTLAERRTP